MQRVYICMYNIYVYIYKYHILRTSISKSEIDKCGIIKLDYAQKSASAN